MSNENFLKSEAQQDQISTVGEASSHTPGKVMDILSDEQLNGVAGGRNIPEGRFYCECYKCGWRSGISHYEQVEYWAKIHMEEAGHAGLSLYAV
ncbi:hypothetical protein [Petroclostridium sp. X23]|uniref:hypothetical protein n=1 Tax=Petroclostridium sp. X23 TaxID=3045146 RepID=UPI0024AC98FA|nr:hypothetical protein [Petroclostridium sp. X23]WHH58763.1 hypothetical protein QKW49_23720 [Petroclostridium sp. X23]